MSSIFISHTTADKELATLLSETLRLGGVPSEEIFYSAQRSTGIPAGKPVDTYLRGRLSGAKLVIELISQKFLTRPLCLMELGGAWALDLPTFPVAVPPLKPMDIARQIGNFHTHKLSTDEAVQLLFDELHDRVEETLDIRLRSTSWGEAVDRFRRGLEAALRSEQDVGEEEDEAAAAGSPRRPVKLTDHGDGLVSTNYTVNNSAFGLELRGDLQNAATGEARRSVILSASFRNADHSIVAVASGAVNDLKPGHSKTFVLQSPDRPGDWKEYTVQIDTMF